MDPAEAINQMKAIVAILVAAGVGLYLIPRPDYCQHCAHCRAQVLEAAERKRRANALYQEANHSDFHKRYPMVPRGDKDCNYCVRGVK